MEFERLIAIDPSLTCSGWACFAIQNEQILAIGKIPSLSSDYSMSTRLKDLQNKISSLFDALELSANDVLICEAPTSMSDPRGAFKVEQVRCIFEVLARERGALVPGRIHPRSVQYELMGLKGHQLARTLVKDTALRIAHSLYKNDLEELSFEPTIENLRRNQDIVDAILIGSLAVSKINALYGMASLNEIFEPAKSALGRGGY